jgi:cation diffusion facilitator CzcD-associated flavoprotein CzcO
MDTSGDKYHRFCITIGGGPSGLIQVADLLRKGILQHNNLEILEWSDGYGGVYLAIGPDTHLPHESEVK